MFAFQFTRSSLTVYTQKSIHCFSLGRGKIVQFLYSVMVAWNRPNKRLFAMDYVRHGEIQGCSLVLFKAHCPCILPCLTCSMRVNKGLNKIEKLT